MPNMVGLLVRGSNHWIVERTDGGTDPPEAAVAIALARQWTFIGIGGSPVGPIGPWRIINKAFRQELAWAVVVPGTSDEGPISAAVQQLLDELRARGVVPTVRD